MKILLKVWMRMNFKEELRIRTDYADNVVKEFLPEEEGFNKELCEAMNYSVNAGGKDSVRYFCTHFTSCSVVIRTLLNLVWLHTKCCTLIRLSMMICLPLTMITTGVVCQRHMLVSERQRRFLQVMDFYIRRMRHLLKF